MLVVRTLEEERGALACHQETDQESKGQNRRKVKTMEAFCKVLVEIQARAAQAWMLRAEGDRTTPGAQALSEIDQQEGALRTIL